MDRLDRVVSKFLKENASKREKIHIFFEDLISDLKKLNHTVIRKLSVDESYIIDKLILNTISTAEKYFEDFNSYMQYHTAQWEEIIKEFKSPKSIKQDEDLIAEMTIFRKDLVSYLEAVSEDSNNIIDNLKFLENSYDLTEDQSDKITFLKAKLEKISSIKYESFINYLFTVGKLPQI